MIDSPYAPAPPLVTIENKEAASSDAKSQTMMMNRLRKHGPLTTPLRPPRSPAAAVVAPEPTTTPTQDDRLEDYAGRLQLGSAEDLSYGDFNKYEGYNNDNEFDCYNDHYTFENNEKEKKPQALSAFFQSEKKSSISTNLFRRRTKISSVDVASVGNGSDTAVSVNSTQYLSGREIHEKAKVHFNAGKYSEALPLFESILSAQVRRFSPLHPSVGAAMHNVGVSTESYSFFFQN